MNVLFHELAHSKATELADYKERVDKVRKECNEVVLKVHHILQQVLFYDRFFVLHDNNEYLPIGKIMYCYNVHKLPHRDVLFSNQIITAQVEIDYDADKQTFAVNYLRMMRSGPVVQNLVVIPARDITGYILENEENQPICAYNFLKCISDAEESNNKDIDNQIIENVRTRNTSGGNAEPGKEEKKENISSCSACIPAVAAAANPGCTA